MQVDSETNGTSTLCPRDSSTSESRPNVHPASFMDSIDLQPRPSPAVSNATGRVKLRSSMFNLPTGKRIPHDLFVQLMLLQNDVLAWIDDGNLSDECLGSRSTSSTVSSELDFLQCIEVAFNSDDGPDGYEFIRKNRDDIVALHRRGQQIEDTFKGIIAHPSANGEVRPLLDALMQLAEITSVYSSRAQRLNALLVRWCNEDNEKVRRVLRQRLTQARDAPGFLPTGADMQALRSLAPNQWLSDEIVNSMLVLMPPKNGILVLDSFFYSWVARHEWDRLPMHNMLMRNGPKLLDQPWRRIIFPINETKNHWICICLDFELRTATVYDSLSLDSRLKSRAEIMENLKQLVIFMARSLFRDIRPKHWCFDPNYFESAIQENGHECGVYTILFALHLHGGDIDGDHVPKHLRVPHTHGSLDGLRLLMLEMMIR